MLNSVPEHLPLCKQQNQRQHCTEDIRHGAGTEHSRKAVKTQILIDYRHEIHHRDEEDDLSREAGDDGNPRLVDTLEEVRVYYSKGNERRHHGDIRQCHLRDIKQKCVVGERHRDDTRHGATDNSRHNAKNHAYFHGQDIDLL